MRRQVIPSIGLADEPSDGESNLRRQARMSQEEFKRTARLSDAMRQEVLDRMDQHAQAERDAAAALHINQRKDARWSFRQSDIAVTVEHPAGGLSRLLLFSRNLSAGGISFVHNGFLYPQSRCKITLPKSDGQFITVTGAIVTCRHLNGLLHEIGLKFDRRVDPGAFLGAVERQSSETEETLELPELHARVLAVESSEVDATLLQHHLKISGMAPQLATTTGAALDLIKQHVADIVLCELNIDGGDGVEFIQKLREASFTGPIMVITAETDQARLEAATTAGAEHVLAKPYDTGQLLSLLVEMNQKIGTVLNRAALFSSVDEQAGMAELVVNYIEQVRHMARQIDQAVGQDNIKAVRQLCLGLKGSASGYGFGPLGEHASQAIAALDSGQALREVQPRLRTLCMLCQRLRVRPKTLMKGVNRGSSHAA